MGQDLLCENIKHRLTPIDFLSSFTVFVFPHYYYTVFFQNFDGVSRLLACLRIRVLGRNMAQVSQPFIFEKPLTDPL